MRYVLGLVIGVVPAVLGVAGGELLIPTLISYCSGPNIKPCRKPVTGSQLPPMTWLSPLHRDQSFTVIGRNWTLLVVMAAGSDLRRMARWAASGDDPELRVLPWPCLDPVLSAMRVLAAPVIRHWTATGERCATEESSSIGSACGLQNDGSVSVA